MHTEMTSAQAFEGYRSPLRGSIASPSLEGVPSRQLSHEFVTSLTTNRTISVRQLYDLRLELDHQCLRLAASISLNPQEDATSDVNSVKELAVFLSGALNECGYPGRSLFETIQLRALVSSLALLHHRGVTTLAPETWDKLKIDISARFQSIAFQTQSNLTIAQRIRYAPNIYLIQLVSQYLSYIRRGDSNVPSIVAPAIKIVFAGIAVVSGFLMSGTVNSRLLTILNRGSANTITHNRY